MTRLFSFLLVILFSINASAQTDEVSPLAESPVLVEIVERVTPVLTELAVRAEPALTEIAERTRPTLTELAVRVASSPTMDRLSTGDIIDPAVVRPRAMVSFEVRGFVANDASDVLLDLSQADALRTLSASSTLSGSDTAPQGMAVKATLRFESVAQWATWRALPETQALLARLDNGPLGLQTQFDAVVLD